MTAKAKVGGETSKGHQDGFWKIGNDSVGGGKKKGKRQKWEAASVPDSSSEARSDTLGTETLTSPAEKRQHNAREPSPERRGCLEAQSPRANFARSLGVNV